MQLHQITAGMQVIYSPAEEKEGVHVPPMKAQIISTPRNTGNGTYTCTISTDKGVVCTVPISQLDPVTPGSLLAAKLKGLKEITDEEIKEATRIFFAARGITASNIEVHTGEVPDFPVEGDAKVCNCPCHRGYTVNHIMHPCCDNPPGGAAGIVEPYQLDKLKEIAFYTIYDHPTDIPELYVIKRQIVRGTTIYIDKSYVFWSKELSECRAEMERMHLVQFARSAEDDPLIIETWMQ